MALSKVDIYNHALGRLSHSVRIASFTEQSKEADLADLYYDQIRESLLTDHPWNFAHKVKLLSLLPDTAPPGWTYLYGYPNDCLRALQILDESGQRLTWSQRFSYFGEQNIFTLTPRYPFEIYLRNSGTSKGIATDLEDAYLRYTADVEDTNLFSTLFIEALIDTIAWRIAGPLRVNAKIMQVAAQQAVYSTQMAKAQDLNEREMDVQPEADSIRARNQ